MTVLEKVSCSRTGTWPVEPFPGGCRRQLVDTTPTSQPHFLVQYQGREDEVYMRNQHCYLTTPRHHHRRTSLQQLDVGRWHACRGLCLFVWFLAYNSKILTSPPILGWKWEFLCFVLCFATQLARQLDYIKNAHRWRAVMRKPGSAWLKGTPAISCHMFICVVVCACSRHALEKVFVYIFCDDYERATAWLFHLGESQNYCASHLSSRRSDW